MIAQENEAPVIPTDGGKDKQEASFLDSEDISYELANITGKNVTVEMSDSADIYFLFDQETNTIY